MEGAGGSRETMKEAAGEEGVGAVEGAGGSRMTVPEAAGAGPVDGQGGRVKSRGGPAAQHSCTPSCCNCWRCRTEQHG